MAVSVPIQQNFISGVPNRARAQLDVLGSLTEIHTLWAGSPNFDSLITPPNIDDTPSFAESGLTTTEQADAIFVLATIRTTILNAFPALTKLARRP